MTRRPDDGMKRRSPADDPLVRLVADEILGDAESAVWQDERFLAWWAEDASRRARAAAAALSDEEFLAQGLALRARVRGRQLGIVRYRRSPVWRSPACAGPPGAVLEAASAVGAVPVVGDLDQAAAAGAGRDLWDEPCEAWVDAPADAPAGRHVALRVRGDSMTPVIASGELVLVRLDPDVRVDTVIVARHPDDGYVCKRVAAVRASEIALESYAPDGPSLSVPRDPRCVVGTVVGVWSRE